MSALDNIPCAHTPLHQRAAAILAAHGDMLQDQRRSDDLVFLNMLVRRHIVFGTPRYEARLDEIQAEYPISNIAIAQADTDVAAVVKSNRG